eukprot:CAMPEP_0115388530 /NCGR_PEP_ID=MMETSP0271-20121206/9220_1 /TAXON_ID=71861 /ORGANISM="Scrippsiella trochoidea, Strain CCMP3099" /LENGTH=105 /DNA_ID=CAMNT_0002812017 /DNA_START=164 /DNA_END=481 /DNA_ORIENTATION=-
MPGVAITHQRVEDRNADGDKEYHEDRAGRIQKLRHQLRFGLEAPLHDHDYCDVTKEGGQDELPEELRWDRVDAHDALRPDQRQIESKQRHSLHQRGQWLFPSHVQ